MKLTALTTLGAVAALACASQADAQAKPKAATPAAARPAAPATPAVQLTAPVPGVCVLSREGLIEGSTVGAFVVDRLKQLGAVVQAEVTADQTALQNDAKALDAKKPTLQADAYGQQAQALQQRLGLLQQKAQQRDREMQATQQKAYAHILQAASPLVGQVVQTRACGIVVDGNSVLAENPSLDITPAVITALNGTLTQFAFDREHLDAQPGQPAQ